MKKQSKELWTYCENDRRQFLKLAGYGTLGLIDKAIELVLLILLWLDR